MRVFRSPDPKGTFSLQRAVARLIFLLVIGAAVAFAQASPWESAAQKPMQAFTGVIARALSLVAIVIGGLTMAFSETGGKRVVAGIVFGVGMAVGAVNFLSWLYGV